MHLPTLTCTRTDRNPYTDDPTMDHWRCTLHYTSRTSTRQMTAVYSLGSDHHERQPLAVEVISSLFSDANCGEESFKDFCDNCGYSDDSRKAERISKAFQSISIRLHKLLGSDYAAMEEYVREQRY